MQNDLRDLRFVVCGKKYVIITFIHFEAQQLDGESPDAD